MRISDWSSDVCSSDLSTAPTVIYEVLKTDGTILPLDNPAKLPQSNLVEEVRETIIRANILTPPDYVGNVITLREEKRGSQVVTTSMCSQVPISYELTTAELVLAFFNRIKLLSSGYASLPTHSPLFNPGTFCLL